jgi:DNA polymerase III epsilon subunit-like protein
MYLFIDLETNGRPANNKAPYTDLDNWPRITQIAWVACTSDKLINKQSSLVKPDGWTVPTEQFFIDNNMSTERCEKEGIPLPILLKDLVSDMEHCELIISHNILFDINVLKAELIRYNIEMPKELIELCTMQTSTDYCKIPGKYGYKWPTLEELHFFLFNSKFEGAHDALTDVFVLAKCFFELERRGLYS